MPAMQLLDLLEAMVASSRKSSARVEVGVLIEWKDIARVPVAKDVAAPAAVVSSDEIAETALASRVIADRRLGIGLVAIHVSDRKDMQLARNGGTGCLVDVSGVKTQRPNTTGKRVCAHLPVLSRR